MLILLFQTENLKKKKIQRTVRNFERQHCIRNIRIRECSYIHRKNRSFFKQRYKINKLLEN